jgi:hypothetical protein
MRHRVERLPSAIDICRLGGRASIKTRTFGEFGHAADDEYNLE